MRPTPANKPSREVRAALVLAYQNGASLIEAAAPFGLSSGATRAALREAGVPIRNAWKQLRLTEEEKSILIRDYLEGASVKELGRRIGRSGDAMLAMLKQWEVPTRGISEARRVYRLDEEFFARIDTEEKAWLLGYITADACLNVRRQCSLVFTCAAQDREILERVRQLLRYEGPVHVYGPYDYGHQGKPQATCSLGITSRRLVEDLLRLGVTPRKSLTAEPWEGPPELMRHWFRGAVDGDGWISKGRRKSKTGGSPHYCVGLAGSHAVVTAFVDFLDSHLGIRPKVCPNSSIYYARLGGVGNPQKVARLLYEGCTIAIARKQTLAEELMAVVPHRAAYRGAGERRHSKGSS